MSRRMFGASQKRKNDDDPEQQLSTSKMRYPSPYSSVSHGLDKNEFDESDISDWEYEETEIEVEDYNKEDDHVLLNECLAGCGKESYNAGWKADSETATKNDFTFSPENLPLANYENEEKAFCALISPGIINMIVKYTNLYIARKRYSFQNKRMEIPNYYHDTNEIEIKSLIGIWIKLGITGFHNSSVDEIFSISDSSSLDAHRCFSKHRYTVLMRSLRFDDKLKRAKNADGKWTDKFCHIRELYEIFTRNTRNLYQPGEYLTVDEILLPTRCRCSFRMFIPSKAAKFGIKIFCLVDPKTMYMVNSQVYLGKQENADDKGLGAAVVKNLSSEYLGHGRTLVTDNFFTSSQLGQELLENKTFLLGTIRSNRTGNPADFIKEPLEIGKTRFVFRNQETLLKFQAKETKQVLLYSTKHHGPEIHSSKKPKVIMDYNSTKFAVDKFDQMCGDYAYAPPVRRWPLRIFMHLVDVAALNAFVLCGKTKPRREFIHKLAELLMKDQKEKKDQEATKSNWIHHGFKEIDEKYEQLQRKKAGLEPHTVVTPNRPDPSQKEICHVCGKRCFKTCNRCHKFFCYKHQHKSDANKCSEHR